MEHFHKTRRLFCSTGAIIGRSNGFNYHLITDAFSSFMAEGLMDGGELMMLKAYYDKIDAIKDELTDAELTFPVIHCEKDVGTMLSDRAVAIAAGDEVGELTDEIMRLFRLNCKMGENMGSERMVLHLWGGLNSDANVDENIAVLPRLIEIANAHGLELLIENVPCSTNEPYPNWKKIMPYLGDGASLIFDTRFGAFHGNTDEIWTDADMRRHITHIHISDAVGWGGNVPRDFTRLRPVLHPGEGIFDFSAFAHTIDAVGYGGTFTVESAVMLPDGTLDLGKMRDTLRNVKNIFHI